MNRFQKRQDKKRKLKLQLPPNQEAHIGEDGKIAVRSTDIRGKDNYGVVSAMGSVGKQILYKQPTLEACDADYLMRQSLPRISDRENNLYLF